MKIQRPSEGSKSKSRENLPKVTSFLMGLLRIYMKNKSQTFYSLIFFASSLFLFYGCPDKKPCPTCPPPGSDTTSHNFVWHIDTLGDGGGSSLYDVAIINDNLAYAVGEIQKKDSTGKYEPLPYNFVKWNGNRWQLTHIEFPLYNYDCTVAGYASVPAQAIFAFSANSIIITDGWAVMLGNGSSFAPLSCISTSIWKGTILKFWGTSSNDFYAVGRNGMIAHYYNNNWQKIESGTTLDIRDIWGAFDPNTSEQQILAVASNDYEKRLLRIQGTTVSFLADSGLPRSITGIWFAVNKQYYIIGDGIFYSNTFNPLKWEGVPNQITSFFTTRVRGIGWNDLVIVGAFGEVLHYNGSSWMSYRSYTALENGVFGGLTMKGNLIIAVGQDNQRAIIGIGRR